MLVIITATITFLILDSIWLGLIAKSMYIQTLGHVFRVTDGSMQPIWPAAIVVYIALISGIIAFVLPKAGGQLLPALLWGGLFGFVTYATYDFTNLAVLAHWSLKVSIIDTLWGMFICGITSMMTVWVTR